MLQRPLSPRAIHLSRATQFTRFEPFSLQMFCQNIDISRDTFVAAHCKAVDPFAQLTVNKR